MAYRLGIAFVFFLLAFSSPISFGEEQRLALVIGNQAYPRVPLTNPANDAKMVSKALDRLGFKTETLTNASKEKMREALDAFLRKVSGRSAVSVFYYAGHGVQFRDRNWILGVDVNLSAVDQGALDVQELLSNYKPGADSTHVVILDACRDYVSGGTKGQAFAPIEAPPGMLLAFSTAPGRFASDGAGSDRNGVYTKHLLKYLNTPGVPVESVFKKVRIGVIEDTQGQQIPWENSSLTRDIYFNPAPPGYFASTEKSPVATPKTKTSIASIQTVDSLTTLYLALAEIRGGDRLSRSLVSNLVENATKPESKAAPVDQANEILFRLTGLRFSEDELKEMSKNLLTVGATITPLPAYSRELLGLRESGGMLITGIEQRGTAERVGLREGDVLLKINGKVISTEQELLAMSDSLRPGEVVYATIFRAGKIETISGGVERTSVDELIFAAINASFKDKNYARAKQLLKPLADKGHAGSVALLANMAFNDADYELAVQYAQKASDLGNGKGDFWLVMANLKGLGIPQDIGKANQLRLKRAEKGDAWALSGLGLAYLQGQGVGKDYQKSRLYLEKAAAQGHFDGLLGLGIMYERGLGVQQNPQEALRWYEYAAATGNLSAKQFAAPRIRALKNMSGTN